MALTVNVWSKVAVAVQTAIATAKTITAITKASPAVATSVAHGFVVGDVLLLEVGGMTQLNFAVKRVGTVPTVDSFSLEGVDSTLYNTFESGTAKKLTFGATCATLQDVNANGGEVEPIVIQTIHDDQAYEIPGNRSPMVFTFGSLWDIADPALVEIAKFDDKKSVGCMVFTFATGAKLYFAAYMSANLAPQGSSGQAVTTPVSFRLRGRITTYTS